MTSTTAEGIKRVKQGNYAYLLESTTNDYARQRDCDLMQIGDLLDSKNYGFGLQKHSKWRESISNGLLMLQEKGIIQQAYDKWWRQIGAENCEQQAKKADQTANPMTFSSVGGLFLILAVGIVISILVGLVEFVWRANKKIEAKVEEHFFF